MATEATILVVEDDASLRRSLEVTLKAAGYVVVGVGTLADARRMRAHHRPQAILLDLGLPDGDGLDLIYALRAEDDLTPMVVLTARDAESLKVYALDAGADDYVTKPFGLDELLARLRAALRHAVQAAGSAPVVRTGPLEIDLGARVVRREPMTARVERAQNGDRFYYLARFSHRPQWPAPQRPQPISAGAPLAC